MTTTADKRAGVTANSTVDAGDDQDKRSWFRELFEAQNAAFTPYGENQPSIGWYFWAWKTEYDIDAWSYRKGLQFQYIPSNISNASTYAFPILGDGCIDTSVKYTSPATFTSTTTSTSATGTGAPGVFGTTSAKKGSASSMSPSRWLMASLGGVSIILLRLLI
jgi:glucan 1,3-beta-glucosidase